MNDLSNSWFLKEPIDYELKTFQLKLYVQSTLNHYKKLELYPRYEEVIKRRLEIEELIFRERTLRKGLKSNMTGINLNNLSILRDESLLSSEYLEVLSQIMEFSLPKLKMLEREGETIEEFMAVDTSIEPVGIESLYKKEGYLLIINGRHTEVPIFRYRSGLLDREKQPVILFTYLKSVIKSVFENYASLKRVLINEFKDLPNPSTFAMISKHEYPLHQAILPLAKKKLIPFICD